MPHNSFKIRDEISRILGTQTRTQAESRLHSLVDSCVVAAKQEERKAIGSMMFLSLPAGEIDAMGLIRWIKSIITKLEHGERPEENNDDRQD